ncbi:MAG: Ku protein [Rhizobiaceae bacterium]|nr:Ku protein [Rhizobiaceae bacterium]
MASRAIWKGQMRLSLVSIAVELHSATRRSASVSFRQIHEPTGKRIRYEKVAEGVGPVDPDDIVKGYEQDGEYVLIDPEEIDAIRLETKKTFELVQFVGACEIPPIYFDKPYYIVPADELAEDAYRVIRDALRRSQKTALGQLTMRGKEYLAAVCPCGDGLLLETLHYADEIRNADPLFSAIEDEASDDELLDVATSLIDKKTAAFSPEDFRDHYREALEDLLAKKQKNRRTPRAKADHGDGGGSGENVVDLMGALKKSLEGTKSGGGKSSSGAKGKAKPKTGTQKGIMTWPRSTDLQNT